MLTHTRFDLDWFLITTILYLNGLFQEWTYLAITNKTIIVDDRIYVIILSMDFKIKTEGGTEPHNLQFGIEEPNQCLKINKG